LVREIYTSLSYVRFVVLVDGTAHDRSVPDRPDPASRGRHLHVEGHSPLAPSPPRPGHGGFGWRAGGNCVTGTLGGGRARWLSPARYFRQLAFLAVGGGCFAFQLCCLVALIHLGMGGDVANTLSFALGAEMKFVLSLRWVWRDRSAAGQMWRRCARFNATTLVVYFVDQGVFSGTHSVLTPIPAAALGVAVGTLVSYVVCDRLVFRPVPQQPIADSLGAEF
jgi:putative flippase GtrA